MEMHRSATNDPCHIILFAKRHKVTVLLARNCIPYVTAKCMKTGVELLLRGVVGKLHTLLDVALEALNGLAQELFLLVGNALQGVDGLLSTVGLICS
jgi:hypothetical protein